MRIISGKLKGRRFNPPANLPARPTTDFAKTGLFNVLASKIDFEGLQVLDLFGGTGSISFEFASRGAAKVIYVERDFRSVRFVKDEKEKLRLENIQVTKSDVFSFLKNCGGQFDVIFADPPYDSSETKNIPGIVFEKNLLREDGFLILEHGEREDYSALPFFSFSRDYGNVMFSFFSQH